MLPVLTRIFGIIFFYWLKNIQFSFSFLAPSATTSTAVTTERGRPFGPDERRHSIISDEHDRNRSIVTGRRNRSTASDERDRRSVDDRHRSVGTGRRNRSTALPVPNTCLVCLPPTRPGSSNEIVLVLKLLMPVPAGAVMKHSFDLFR